MVKVRSHLRKTKKSGLRPVREHWRNQRLRQRVGKLAELKFSEYEKLSKFGRKIKHNIDKNEFTTLKLKVSRVVDPYYNEHEESEEDVIFWGMDSNGDFLGYYEFWDGHNWRIGQVYLDQKTGKCSEYSSEDLSVGEILAKDIDWDNVVLKNTSDELQEEKENLADYLFTGSHHYGHNVAWCYNPETGKVESYSWMGSGSISTRGDITIPLFTMSDQCDSYWVDYDNITDFLELDDFEPQLANKLKEKLRDDFNYKVDDSYVNLSKINPRLVFDRNVGKNGDFVVMDDNDVLDMLHYDSSLDDLNTVFSRIENRFN